MSEKANVELMSGKSKPSKACSLIMIAVSLILCAGAFVASVWFPNMVDGLIIDSGVLCADDDKETKDDFKGVSKDASTLNEDFVFYTWDEADAIAFATTGDAKAKVTEQGPYRFKKSTENYGLEFLDGELKFKVAQTWSFDAEFSVDLDPYADTVLVQSLGYQSLITKATNELVFLLSGVGCSPEQLGAISSATATAFTGDLTELCAFPLSANVNDPTCGCCIANSAEAPSARAALEAGLGGPIGLQYQYCEDLIQDATLRGLLNNLARTDRSLATVLDPVAGNTYTPAFHELTVFQLAFGYPSAVVGFFLTQTLDDTTVDGITSLVGISGFSNAIHTACMDTCVAGFEGWIAGLGNLGLNEASPGYYTTLGGMSCPGSTLKDEPATTTPIFTGSMPCEPSSFGFYAMNVLAAPGVASLAGTAAFDPVMCYRGTSEASGPIDLERANPLAAASGENYKIPCCIKSGSSGGTVLAGGTNLRGMGCMAPIPGRIADTWYTSISAAKSYHALTQTNKAEAFTTGCAAGKEDVAWTKSLFNDETAYPVWSSDTGRALPAPGLVATFVGTLALAPTAPTIVYSPVTGLPGTQVKPEGLEGRSFAGAHLSDTSTVTIKKFKLYESNSKLSLFVTQKRASTVKEIPTIRYELADEALHWDTEDNKKYGVGVIDGYVPLIFHKGTSIALSQPNFFNADSSFYDSLEIKASSEATEALVQAEVNKESEAYQTYFEVEKATGKTFKAHQRLQVNMYIGVCDFLNPYSGSCGLALSETNAVSGIPNGIPTSVFNVVTPKMQGGVHVPLYRIDRNAEIEDEDADSFKSLEKTLQLFDIVGVVMALAGVLLGLCGVVRCLQG